VRVLWSTVKRVEDSALIKHEIWRVCVQICSNRTHFQCLSQIVWAVFTDFVMTKNLYKINLSFLELIQNSLRLFGISHIIPISSFFRFINLKIFLLAHIIFYSVIILSEMFSVMIVFSQSKETCFGKFKCTRNVTSFAHKRVFSAF
jgi:hypothetical protein